MSRRNLFPDAPLIGLVAALVWSHAAQAQFTVLPNQDLVYKQGKVTIAPTSPLTPAQLAPQAQFHLWDIYQAGGKNLLLGDDAFLSDIDQSNTLGLYGNQNPTIGCLKLGSGGSSLCGKNGGLGVANDNPQELLQLGDSFVFHDGGTKVLGYNFDYSGGQDRRLLAAGVATIRFGTGGDLELRTAGSGPAGSVIQYPPSKVIINSAGHLGIGGPPNQAQLEVLDLYPAGFKNLLVGNDAFFSDIDEGNVLGLFGNYNPAIAGLKLGSSGPLLSGADGNLGLATTKPQARLHVAQADAIIGDEGYSDSSGSSIWVKNSNPTNSPFSGKLFGVAAADLDGGAVYLAGNANNITNEGWRLEKRRKDNGNLVPEFGSNGVVQELPLPGAMITAIAISGGVLYVVGHNDNLSVIDNSRWIMEARDKISGNLLWRKFSDPSINIVNSIYNDTANSVAVDATSVYVGGQNYGISTSSWRIEKRDKVSGDLVVNTPFGNQTGVLEFPLSGGTGAPLAMREDGGDLYLVGYAPVGGDTGWRMQKVNSTTGSNAWTSSSAISGGGRAQAFVFDGASLYVAGNQGGFADRWRLEKRDKSTGALVAGAFPSGWAGGVITEIPDGRLSLGIALDPTGLYIAGTITVASGQPRWRIEKRNPGTGVLVSGFGIQGVILENPSPSLDEAFGVVADTSGVYVFGQDRVPGRGEWRIEKLKGLEVDFRGLTVVAGGNVGIGTKSPGNILTVRQNSSTDPIADSWTTYSSRRWKTDIQPLGNALELVQQLQGVRYRSRDTAEPAIGLIAEDVGKVIPEVVALEPGGKDAKGLDYARLVAVLIEAIKEQQLQIEELRSLIPPNPGSSQ